MKSQPKKSPFRPGASMKKGAWKKSSEDLVELFENVFPGPPAEQRKMFGYPAGFVNGNMFTGLFQEQFFVRLDEKERTELLKTSGARIFEPMSGRPMKEYVVLPPSIRSNSRNLSSWVNKALEYGKSLPSKSKTSLKPTQ